MPGVRQLRSGQVQCDHGLEHELAVLGGGEHEDEFEHRHGDELDAQLPVPVGPGAVFKTILRISLYWWLVRMQLKMKFRDHKPK